MNLATPVLICHHSEDFKTLLRDMLTKHGFFHVMETSSASELIALSKQEKKNSFLLIEAPLLDDSLMSFLSGATNFLIFLQTEDKRATTISARFGVKHILSFPFSSQLLFERIKKVSQN